MSQDTQGKAVMVQGRIVWVSGDLFKGRLKIDQNTKQQKYDKAGNPVTEYGFGLAVPKSALQHLGPGQPGEIWSAMQEQAFQIYPSRQIPPGFAWKYKDGDGVDDKGVPFSQREGYAQHVVFAMTTQVPIKYFRHENGGNIMINEGIKCGDYVNVQVMVKAHAASGTFKPGVYLNPNAVQFLGFGKEIINAPSGDQIFGLVAPPMPPGASAIPLAPQPGQILVPPQAPIMSAPGVPSAPAPAPHWGVVPAAHQPPPGGMPAPGNGYAPPVGAQPMQMAPQQQVQMTAASPAFPSNPGNGYPQPGGYPVPGVTATPMGQPMGAPSFAAPAVNPVYPPQQFQPPLPGYPAAAPMPWQPGMPTQ